MKMAASDVVNHENETKDTMSNDRSVKVICLGDSAVGKSNKPQQLSTYALTLFQYKTLVDGIDVRVDFWDTAGQERFSSMHPSYYHQAHSCLLVFDITRKGTYKNLAKWYKELRDYRENIPCIVIANKIDVDYTITQKSFNFPKKHGLPFYFVSASDGTNVVKAFREAIVLAVKYKENSTDFMDEVLRELESFDDMNLNQDGYDSSDKKSSEDEGKT